MSPRSRTGAAFALFACAALLYAALLGCEARPSGAGGRIAEILRAVDAEGYRLPEANVVIQVAPSGLIGSIFYRRVVQELGALPDAGEGAAAAPDKTPDKILGERLGLDLSKIEGAVLGVNFELRKFVLAAVAGEPVRPAELLAGIAKAREVELQKLDTYMGTDLYAPPGEPEGAICLPGEQVIAAGSTPDLMRAIENQKAGTLPRYRPAVARLLEAAPRRADIVIAAVPTPMLMKELDRALRATGLERLSDRAEGILAAATAGSYLEVTVRMFMRTEEDAEQARKEAEEALTGMKEKLRGALDERDMRPLRDLISGVEIGRAGRTVEIEASVRPEIARSVVKLWGASAAPGR